MLLSDLTKLAVVVADVDEFCWNMVTCLQSRVSVLAWICVNICRCLLGFWQRIQGYSFFVDTVHISDICTENITSNFSLMKISDRQWTWRLTNSATTYMATCIGQQIINVPTILYLLCLCFILVNLYWGLMFVFLWQTSMNALIITETVTHRRSAPTRLAASPVPVLTDILATGSHAQVTNEQLFYILPFFVSFSSL